jgi:hypothetical protein
MDAVDPHAHVRFWAAALGYEVEDTTVLIRGLLDAGLVTDEIVFEADGQLWFNDLVGARDPDGRRPRVLVQRTPEAKGEARNRVHLDLNVGPEQRAAEVERLTALGARVLYEVDEPGGRHTTLADPEGNELCVQ